VSSRRQPEASDVISSYQFVNDYRLEDDRVSKSSFSPVSKETLQNNYQGFKGLNEQLTELKKEYEIDKMQVSSDIITKAKGLKFLKKV
jgi:hypothetical protein